MDELKDLEKTSITTIRVKNSQIYGLMDVIHAITDNFIKLTDSNNSLVDHVRALEQFKKNVVERDGVITELFDTQRDKHTLLHDEVDALREKINALEDQMEIVAKQASFASAEVQGLDDTVYGDKGDNSPGLVDLMKNLEAQGKEMRKDIDTHVHEYETPDERIEALEKRVEEVWDMPEHIHLDLVKRIEKIEGFRGEYEQMCKAINASNGEFDKPMPEPVCETCGGDEIIGRTIFSDGQPDVREFNVCPSCQPKSCENCGNSPTGRFCLVEEINPRECFTNGHIHWTPKSTEEGEKATHIELPGMPESAIYPKSELECQPPAPDEAWLLRVTMNPAGELSYYDKKERANIYICREWNVNPADLIPADRLKRAEELLDRAWVCIPSCNPGKLGNEHRKKVVDDILTFLKDKEIDTFLKGKGGRG